MKNIKIYNSRKRSNFIGLSLSMIAMTLGMIVLTWILFVLISKGFSAFNSNFFFNSTPAAGSAGGGLANAIYDCKHFFIEPSLWRYAFCNEQ